MPKKDNDVLYSNFDKTLFEDTETDSIAFDKKIVMAVAAIGVVVLCIFSGILFAKFKHKDTEKAKTSHITAELVEVMSETENHDFSLINIITPDCLGKNKDEVLNTLNFLGITYNIISTPSYDKEKNRVISQSIEPGEEIPKGAVLTLIIGEGAKTTTLAVANSSSQTNSVIPISTVKINLSKTVLYLGETAKIEGIYSPSNATQTEFYYVVDNYNIAYTNNKNYVCAIGPGTTYIRAKDLSGKELGYCSITVIIPETTNEYDCFEKTTSENMSLYDYDQPIFTEESSTEKPIEIKAFEAWKNDTATLTDMEKIVRFVNDELDSRRFEYGRMNSKGISSQSYYYANDTETLRQYDSIDSLCDVIESDIRSNQLYNNCGNYNIYYEEYLGGKYCIIVSYNYV